MRIQDKHFTQYVAKYPGTTSLTGNPFNIGKGSPFIKYATTHSFNTGLLRSSDFMKRPDPKFFGPDPVSRP